MINNKTSINSERPWSRLMRMAEIGATPAGANTLLDAIMERCLAHTG